MSSSQLTQPWYTAVHCVRRLAWRPALEGVSGLFSISRCAWTPTCCATIAVKYDTLLCCQLLGVSLQMRRELAAAIRDLGKLVGHVTMLEYMVKMVTSYHRDWQNALAASGRACWPIYIGAELSCMLGTVTGLPTAALPSRRRLWHAL